MKKICIYSCFILSIFLHACVSYPPMHVAVAENVPLMTEKYESRYSFCSGTQTIGGQFSLAMTKNIGVMASYSYGTNDLFEYSPYVGNDNGTMTNGEIGLGYFKKIDSVHCFEIFGGFDRFHRDFSSMDTYYRTQDQAVLNITRPFLQIDYGILNSDKNGLGLSLKFGPEFTNNSYFSHKADGRPQYSYSYQIKNSFDVQPSLAYRFGWDSFNFMLQAGISFPNDFIIDNGFPVNSPPEQSKAFLNFGIEFHIQ